MRMCDGITKTISWVSKEEFAWLPNKYCLQQRSLKGLAFMWSDGMTLTIFFFKTDSKFMMEDLWYNPTRLFFLLKYCYWYASVMYCVQRMHNTKIFYRQQYHPHKHGCKFSNTLCCCFKLFSRIQKNPYENSTIPSRSPFGILWIHVRKAVCNFWILSWKRHPEIH